MDFILHDVCKFILASLCWQSIFAEEQGCTVQYTRWFSYLDQPDSRVEIYLNKNELTNWRDTLTLRNLLIMK